MLEIIAIVILISSIFGIGIIIYRKIPILRELPELAGKSVESDFLLKAKEKIKNIPILKSFSLETYLQKILSKIRVLSLRIDSKTFNWLQKLRAQASKASAERKENTQHSLGKRSQKREDKKRLKD